MNMNKMIDDLMWFMGVVEDRKDPIQSGRCRVRCFGYHTKDRNILATDKLPWASKPAIVDVKEGDWVFGFFIDGENAQQPMIITKIDGVPSLPAEDQSDEDGFFDKGVDKDSRPFPPKKIEYSGDGSPVTITEGEADYYPAKSEGYMKQSIDEPDIPRTARSDDFGKTNTAVEQRINFKESGTSANGVTWDEPESPYAPVYPYNRVTQTESGHIIEMDDTPGKERMSSQHRSGTFIEIHPNGETVLKFMNNRYTIVAVDDNISIHGVSNVMIDKDSNILIKEKRFVEILKDDKLDVTGKSDVTIGKDSNISVGENLTTNVTKDSTINISANETRKISGDKTENVSGNSVFTGQIIKLN